MQTEEPPLAFKPTIVFVGRDSGFFDKVANKTVLI
jgi:hypothetical protein